MNGKAINVRRPNDYVGDVDVNAARGPTLYAGPELKAPVVAAPGLLGTADFLAIAGLNRPPSTVLVLKNMVSVEELADDTEYNEILSETREECERFGEVEDLKIPRPLHSGSKIEVKGIGNIYVLFDSKASASKARGAMHGRMFAGNKVEGEFLDESEFHLVDAGKVFNDLSK
jgi:hypothetical protein